MNLSPYTCFLYKGHVQGSQHVYVLTRSCLRMHMSWQAYVLPNLGFSILMSWLIYILACSCRSTSMFQYIYEVTRSDHIIPMRHHACVLFQHGYIFAHSYLRKLTSQHFYVSACFCSSTYMPQLVRPSMVMSLACQCLGMWMHQHQ